MILEMRRENIPKRPNMFQTYIDNFKTTVPATSIIVTYKTKCLIHSLYHGRFIYEPFVEIYFPVYRSTDVVLVSLTTATQRDNGNNGNIKFMNISPTRLGVAFII